MKTSFLYALPSAIALVFAATADAADPKASPPTGLANASFSGKIVETMNSGGYTYVLVDTGDEKRWTATFEFNAKTGEVINVRSSYLMSGFSSPGLGRTFDRIYFASDMTEGTSTTSVVQGIPTGHHGTPENEPPAAPVPGITGKVIETMNSGGYTYVRVKSSNETIWAATTRTEVKKGQIVTVPRGEIMKNFTSPSLNRTFDSIYFVGFITKEGEKSPAEKTNPHGAPAGVTPIPLANPISQPAGGTSVADIHARKSELVGKQVTVKGLVTKVTLEIMDRNWIHLADGTGKAGQNDLTVTTTGTAAVGDIITVSGRVAVDQNFGAGYVYPIIIEKASIAK